MKRFKNILYIIGEEKHRQDFIADKVATVARINNARVTTMIAGEYSFVDQLTSRLSGRLREIQELLTQQQHERLKLFTKHERWNGIPIDTHIAADNGFIGIIHKVLQDDHDLVIKEENLSHGIDQLAMRLVRKCPSPVWIIKTGSSDFTRILGTVDVGTDHPETKRLNRQIVELTHSLAQRENGEAHYTHVWRLEHESMLRGPRFKLSAEEISEMKKSMYDEREQCLMDLLHNLHIDTQTRQIHVVEGQIVDMIRQLIEKMSIDVLVMGSVGRSGIPGLLIGNKAETLLNNINCTVLTVKPDGFISPVTLS